jgi:hypothetical protein
MMPLEAACSRFWAIEEISDNLDMHEEDMGWANETKSNFKSSLHNMYDHYLNKYGSSVRVPTSSSSSSKGSSSKLKDPLVGFINTIRTETQKSERGNTPSSELGRYIGTDFISSMSEEDDNLPARF